MGKKGEGLCDVDFGVMDMMMMCMSRFGKEARRLGVDKLVCGLWAPSLDWTTNEMKFKHRIVF